MFWLNTDCKSLIIKSSIGI